MFGLNGGECSHYLESMNTAAPDLGGVLRVYGEVPHVWIFLSAVLPWRLA
jgi:hypothetical protein